MYYLYLLRCSDNSIYTGIAVDLTARLAKHELGKGSKYVRSRLPFKLVYTEEAATKSGALKRELEIKNLSKEQKELLILNSHA